MIPKILHYCWFGPNKKSEIAERCLESWKTYCPDFEFKEWNESNTKSYQNKFFKDALRKKNYAFASDCIRVQALNEFGGIYLDMDMLLLKPIGSELLELDFFTGFEVDGRAAYGLFGGKAGHKFLKLMTKFYNETEFNEFSLPVITHTFKEHINAKMIGSNERIFPQIVFYALTYENKNEDFRTYIDDSSIAVHLWDHSWSGKKEIGFAYWIRGLRIVLIDYLFYGYSKQYFIRYFRGFSRQLYYRLIGKANK